MTLLSSHFVLRTQPRMNTGIHTVLFVSICWSLLFSSCFFSLLIHIPGNSRSLKFILTVLWSLPMTFKAIAASSGSSWVAIWLQDITHWVSQVLEGHHMLVLQTYTRFVKNKRRENQKCLEEETSWIVLIWRPLCPRWTVQALDWQTH